MRRCYLGHQDSPLTVTGNEQVAIAAEQLRKQIREKSTARLYTSDLGRCVQTAAIVGRALGLEPELDSRLRELNFGQWDGKTYEEIMSSRNRTFLESWYKDPFENAPPEGETLNELGQRVDEWVEQTMASVHTNETIIIVSHGGPIRWFQSRWLRGDATTYWQTDHIPPGGTLIAVWDGKQFILGKGAGE